MRSAAAALGLEWRRMLEQLLREDAVPIAWQRVFVCLVVAACFAVRLWTIDAPALDRTAWKEIDYIAISSNYWQHGFDFLWPEVSWPAEPPRVTEMELPLVPYAAALLYAVFGFSAYTVRITTVLAFLLLTLYVFRLAKRELGPLVGLMAALAASIMPLYHPFGRFLFSEPLMLATSVMGIFHFAEWVEFRRRRDWLLGLVGFTLALALKLEPLYLLLPLTWIAFRKYGWQWRGHRNLLGLPETLVALRDAEPSVGAGNLPASMT